MKSVYKYILLVIAILALIIWASLKTDIFKSQETYRELTAEETLTINNIRRQAYDYAVECSGVKRPLLKYEQIYWALTSGSVITIEATDGTGKFKGYFSPKDSTIYIPFMERETFWIAAHESLHALGYMGHPDVPFRTPCALMPDQRP